MNNSPEKTKFLENKDKFLSSINEHAYSAVLETLNGFVNLLQTKDNYSGDHCMRVALYSFILAEDKHLELSLNQQDAIKCAASVHDLGNYGIEDKQLRETARYNREIPEELAQFKAIFGKHPEDCAKILLKAFHSLIGEEKAAVPILVLYHHWNYNSLETKQGYPHNKEIIDDNLNNYVNEALLGGKYAGFLNKKKGKKIDKNFYRIGIGILRVADSLDAGTVTRYHKDLPYRKDAKDIIAEIKKDSGKKYHPDVVKALERNKDHLIAANIGKLVSF